MLTFGENLMGWSHDNRETSRQLMDLFVFIDFRTQKDGLNRDIASIFTPNKVCIANYVGAVVWVSVV